MTSKVLQSVLSLAFAVHVFAAHATDRAPVVSVTPFKQFFSKQTWDEQIQAIRDQVVAELVQNYECVVLNRSYGYSMALEDAVKRLSTISESEFKPDTIYATDYILTGVFQSGVKGVECVLRIVDLRNESLVATNSQVITINVPDIGKSAKLIAQVIARNVGAVPLGKPAQIKHEAEPVRVWATLPFIFSSVNKDSPDLGTTLRLHAEIALQSDQRVRLVDRSAFDKVLDEKVMRSLTDVAEIGRAVQLAGADRILLGCVMPTEGGKFRADLLGIDSETAEVLTALTQHSEGPESLSADIEKAVAALLASQRVQSRLAPAQINRRVREAKLYLETSKSNANTYSFSGKIAAIEFAEMAYLIARDNADVVGDIVEVLRLFNRQRDHWTTTELKNRVAEIAERIVMPFPYISDSPKVLVARAEVQLCAGNYEFAHRLMQQFADKYPDDLDDMSRRVLGACHLALGKPREALAVVSDTSRHIPTLLLRLRAYRALDDEEQEFALMQTMTHRSLSDLFPRYLELLSKRKGANVALAFIDLSMKRDRWLSSRTQIRFLQAKYCLMAGDRDRASELCQQLWDEGKATNWRCWHDLDDIEAFKTELASLKQAAGYINETWLKAIDTKPFPASCAIYLQPLGTVDVALLERARSRVQDFFGARTETLPMLPLSKDDPSYHQANNKYDAKMLLPDTIKRMCIPSDALAAVIVTQENIYADRLRWIYSRRSKYGVICSYHVWLPQHKNTLEICLRNAIISGISNTLRLKGQFPCITSGTGDATTSVRKKFAYCPDVQKQYIALDLEQKQQEAISYFRQSGASIIQNVVH